MKKVQKKYKDTVFRMLFGRRERALSFLVANQVHLYEHQSTLPANMPLRDLFYIADIFQKFVADKTIYSSRRLTIPNPNFLVFYNGLQPLPERLELKLSDSFAVLTDHPALELKVTLLNINPGMNEALKEKCPDLKEYMLYVEMVRKYAACMELKDAVEKAVDECIRSDILREFLMQQKAEVVKVSIYEFDEEREMQLIREDEREIGRGEIDELYHRLKADDRLEDIMKAIDDKEYRNTLLEEYGIVENLAAIVK